MTHSRWVSSGHEPTLFVLRFFYFVGIILLYCLVPKKKHNKTSIVHLLSCVIGVGFHDTDGCHDTCKMGVLVSLYLHNLCKDSIDLLNPLLHCS